jgi:prenylcysteine oxidase/farnesylcysteine lyase
MDYFRHVMYMLLLLLECVCILGVDTNGQIPLKPKDKTASRNVAIIGKSSDPEASKMC